MISKALLITALIAHVGARFGQEQVPIQAISAVQGGDPGAAATVAGAAISDLLGGANSCAKLQRADQVVSELGGGADAIAAAIGLVTAEKNTNPFANNNVQNVCSDPSLPATAELRGITPLIDPAVDINGDAAALSASSAANPLAADGLSVFDLMSQAGLGDLVVSQAAGANAAAGGNAGSNNQQANNQNQNQNQANGNGNNNNNNNSQQANGNQGSNQNQNQSNNNNQQANGNGNANQNANAGGNASCNAGNANNATESANQNAGNANNSNQNAGNNQANQNQNQNQNAGNNNGNNNQDAGNANQSAADNSTAGADFGQCTPTIIFEGGQNGRPANEFTFQIADPLARGGQQEALNPNIITNALCNQLTNVCDANNAAKAACEDAKAQVQAAGTRDKSTADLFNSALGFAGAVTNPNGGPAEPAASGAAGGGNGNANKRMRRGLRL
ncbi:hypothetical protein BU25DRAFT_37804 [Macroventuria anomochaeta]|uniref:Uncharacterized protein n=1 Tax=Macroventuria anomochaeta TaxID=301207 RepID=A0ACB6S4H7_9PLEO|nr:uncharacterized protein BU25DRAFT_37804 [Macroventuria anomochaeta]KAF2628540.1 hypothetical protein BU25DRAFT_37804 [Macroventuria anomochaeta]